MTNLSIGILAKLVEEDNFKSTVPTSKRYTFNQINSDFIHLAGLDIYPIFPDSSREELRTILSKVNGVLLPGGMTNVTKPNPNSDDPNPRVYSCYAKAAKEIIGEAKRINDAGEYFPVFGICLGYQSMIAAETEDMNIVEKRDVGLGYNATLEYMVEREDSKLLSAIPKWLTDYVANVKSTHNYHEYMVDNNKFHSNSRLTETYKVLSLSKSEDESISFISMIEGNEYPFYGFQFHPEFAIRSYYPETLVNYPNRNIAAAFAQSIMEFIREEASQNSHILEKRDMNRLLANDEGTILYDTRYHVPYHLWD